MKGHGEYSGMNAAKPFVKGIDIRKGVDRKIKLYLVFEACVLETALLLDIFSDVKYKLYQLVFLADILVDKDYNFYRLLCYIRRAAHENLKDFLNVILTLGTILAAAVIFFYSVQDGRKEGIPHRAIMSYTSGSLSVPLLFVKVMIMLPFNYIAYALRFAWLTVAGLAVTYVNHMIIIVIILMSTSHQYSLHAICNAEIIQYRRLCGIRREQERRKKEGSCKNKTVDQAPSFIWTYLLNHLEQVILSEELSSDKMEMARRLLRVPFYEKEIRLWDEMVFKLFRSGGKKGKGDVYPALSKRRLRDNQIKAIYEFYYRNILAVFLYLNQQKDKEGRNKIYVILYEFLEDLTKVYESVAKDHRLCEITENPCRPQYCMAVCGVMNAVLDSNAEESEYFCSYVLGNIVSKDVLELQVSLYILFQEYLYRTNIEAVRLDDLMRIPQINEWKIDKYKDQKLFQCFWEVWTEATTLTEESAYQYFLMAYLSLTGDADLSEPVRYFLWTVKNAKE